MNGAGDGRGGGRAPRGWGAVRGARSLLELLGRWSPPLAFGSVGLLASTGCAQLVDAVRADDAGTALDQQQESGWNVGSEDEPLTFPGAQANDISGGAAWRDQRLGLALRLAPAGARWQPFYSPTLFQSLEAPRNADLREAIRPIYTPEMALAFRRGEALLSLLMDGGLCRTGVGIVLDLDGPEAVAVAAALAPCFDPVFVFANWPHPAGVVPAHLTLGAGLYFLPAFERARAGRPGTAPPAFVLDRRRMAAYVDDAGQFDNRYGVGLPPPEALSAGGVTRLLYVTPDDRVTAESDDLNDDLVAAAQSGVDVQLLALSDFSQKPLPDWPAEAPCDPLVALRPTGPDGSPPFYFGGSLESHACFAYWYGWMPPSPSLPPIPPASSSAAATLPTIPPRLAPRCHFHPTSRVALGGPSFHGHPGGGGFHRSGSLGRFHGGGFFG